MTNAPWDTIEDFRDIEALGQYAQAVEKEGRTPDEVLDVLRARGRDNARTPMQWDSSPQAGFTTGTPWLRVNPSFKEINAAAAVADPDSVYHHYRKLIELRHTEPAVVHGDFTMLAPHDEQIYAYTRRLGATELLVAGNFGATPAALDDLAGWDDAELVLDNTGQAPSDRILGPWQAVVYRRTISR